MKKAKQAAVASALGLAVVSDTPNSTVFRR
ncbi:Uncharacterised protein [Priestia megaterium]|nr:Uncharacterised protein [Priestia megaterium]